jgi:hypothetical protein
MVVQNKSLELTTPVLQQNLQKTGKKMVWEEKQASKRKWLTTSLIPSIVLSIRKTKPK